MSRPLTYRRATAADGPLLAQMNHELIQDEGHRNPMTVPELEERMLGWLRAEYTAVIFDADGTTVGYALYREQPAEVYLRQLYVVRYRRRQGFGRAAVGLLRRELWPRPKRLTVAALTANAAGVAFWRALGFRDYCLTLEILPDSAPPA